MQLSDRIAISALVVTSIGVVVTVYGAYARMMAANRTSRERHDRPLLPTHNDIDGHNLASRRRYIFMEVANRPQVPTEWIPLGEYGASRVADVVD